MLRYLALAISLGMALPFSGSTLAAPIECYPVCDDIEATPKSYDARYNCDRMIAEAHESCSSVVNSYSNEHADALPYGRYGREPVRHPAPGRIVPDASFFGLY